MVPNSSDLSAAHSRRLGRIAAAIFTGAVLGLPSSAGAGAADPLAWPPSNSTTKPWAYWWWMGSAVDTNNLAKELARYRDAGMGGVHVVPIYGAKGWESNYITYLSPRWMEMLAFTVAEAKRLGLGVDMTTGTGWCFGGPRVTDAEANANVVWQTFDVPAGGRLAQKLDPRATQAIMSFTADGARLDLSQKVGPDGVLDFVAGSVPSVLYVVSQRPSGQKVKRASPGGDGHMLNLASPNAMTNYLRWFEESFAHYRGPKPRAQYHDSYEYRTDWSPEFFAEFEKRRGYRLQDELPALFANAQPPRSRGEREPARVPALAVDPDRIARVKCDYRETISDIMVEKTLPAWADWSRRNGFLTRNEAHGSPGNWLDLYATADIPETEMFHLDRNKLISKFASSAAHVAGKNLVASETGTWLAEHWTETLADMKYLLDDLFLSGVNHVIYHGCCYSPDEASWPGWLFYASYEMNPRNPVWRDVPALNAYAARCQAVLQAGKPDNDILLYWPLHDFWSSTNGLARNMSVHARDWFEGQPIGETASALWDRGYAFDYVSDRQLAKAKVQGGKIEVAGSSYRVVVIPKCEHLPLPTLKKLFALTKSGATVVFEANYPGDVPGWGRLEDRRGELKTLLAQLRPGFKLALPGPDGTRVELDGAKLGRGTMYAGQLALALSVAKVPRETLFDHAGLMCIRRAVDGGTTYFIANRGEKPVKDWLKLGRPAKSVLVMDPLSGMTGLGATRQSAAREAEVFLTLAPGESAILRTFAEKLVAAPPWHYWQPSESSGTAVVQGEWSVKFLQGGPELPSPFRMSEPASWTRGGDTNTASFAGSALYSVRFDAPMVRGDHYYLDLGDVRQSARVRFNGMDYGTLLTPPFRVVVDNLKPGDNLLEVEVTSTAANRVRDLDRRGVNWKNFHDINFVNLGYKPFDASNWPLADCGLLGPVTLQPVTRREFAKE